jgi:hypothetical protein
MLITERPLSLAQVADLHGVSKMIVKRAVWRGQIETFRLGRDYRVPHAVAHSPEVATALAKSASVAETLCYQKVYFIGAADGPIKIGRAFVPEQRLKDIQCGYPYPLSVLATVKGGAGLERAYHERYAAHRLNGEWFDRAPEILAEIERLQSPPPTTPIISSGDNAGGVG